MKIDFQNILLDEFMVHQHDLFGEPVLLIQPTHLGVKWSKENIIFRSSVWSKETGELISPGWKKFFNDQENPSIDPLPNDVKAGNVITKIDGSLCIFSLRNGNLITRTRGTIDATTQNNGNEFVELAEKYKVKSILSDLSHNEQVTLLFEITSPNQRIVIEETTKPDLWLIGAIRHENYSYFTQTELDSVGIKYRLKRPKRYFFKTMEELRETVAAFRGIEGVCFYYNNDQCIRKFKGIQYLFLHRAKSEISSIDKVIDVYVDWFLPRHTLSHEPTGYSEFFEYLTTKFDFEIATMATGHASRICDAMKEVHKIMNALFEFASARMNIARNIAAKEVLQAYGSTGRSSIIFKMLDRKVIGSDDYKKLLYQVLK
jgi:hypothetical protein